MGETGTGKTTVCQLVALQRGQRLHILNCNQHTEASDFLGGFRPARLESQGLCLIPSAVHTLHSESPALLLCPPPCTCSKSETALRWCRNRQQAVEALQDALRSIRKSSVFEALAMEPLKEPESLAGPDLRKAAAAASGLLSAVRKRAADVFAGGGLPQPTGMHLRADCRHQVRRYRVYERLTQWMLRMLRMRCKDNLEPFRHGDGRPHARVADEPFQWLIQC